MAGGLGTPQRTIGSRGALPKESLFGEGGKLSLNLFKRSGAFAFNQAKKFNKAQKEKTELQEDQFEAQENIEDVEEQIEQLEEKEQKEIQRAFESGRTPQEARKNVRTVEKKSDKEKEKLQKKKEKEEEKEEKTKKQLDANRDRISQITLILKPSKFA